MQGWVEGVGGWVGVGECEKGKTKVKGFLQVAREQERNRETETEKRTEQQTA
jgi:hypothetical protein